ncbi:hypothetical protein M0813_10276 [Anaeramoeba flamelloides]|uniref:Maturase K n=1 Tax=Anaeramoeba flamelloides TaxID=1746091 RepID=A0ABQ8X502_9EUKA|nr:hypothetical protein M0813_10276 [Anaeramoeba flamelloides]
MMHKLLINVEVHAYFRYNMPFYHYKNLPCGILLTKGPLVSKVFYLIKIITINKRPNGREQPVIVVLRNRHQFFEISPLAVLFLEQQSLPQLSKVWNSIIYQQDAIALLEFVSFRG